MTRIHRQLLIAGAASALMIAQSAQAQHAGSHAGHSMPAEPATAPEADPHAGHTMPSVSRESSDLHEDHAMHRAAEPQDPHAGHDMQAEEVKTADPHASHGSDGSHAESTLGTDLPAGTSPAPPVPTEYAADAIYGPAAMAMGRHHLFQHHGGQKFFMAILDIAEAKIRNGRDAYELGGEAWYGGDISRLVVKSEGEGEFGGGVESAEVQALYSHAIGPYFDLQAGVRYDFQPNPSRVYAAVGFEGLAPGFFDVEGALFLSDKGELMGRLEGYYDQRITQKLILQPRAELNFAAQGSRDIGVGAGLTDVEAGVRLRYDIAREFAPYLGVQYERAFGETRDFRRDEGEAAGGWSFLAGIRMWF